MRVVVVPEEFIGLLIVASIAWEIVSGQPPGGVTLVLDVDAASLVVLVGGDVQALAVGHAHDFVGVFVADDVGVLAAAEGEDGLLLGVLDLLIGHEPFDLRLPGQFPDLARVEHQEGVEALHHEHRPPRAHLGREVDQTEPLSVRRRRRAEVHVAVRLAEHLALGVEVPLLLVHVLALLARPEPHRARRHREPHAHRSELGAFPHRRKVVPLVRVVSEDPVAVAVVLILGVGLRLEPRLVGCGAVLDPPASLDLPLAQALEPAARPLLEACVVVAPLPLALPIAVQLSLLLLPGEPELLFLAHVLGLDLGLVRVYLRRQVAVVEEEPVLRVARGALGLALHDLAVRGNADRDALAEGLLRLREGEALPVLEALRHVPELVRPVLATGANRVFGFDTAVPLPDGNAFGRFLSFLPKSVANHKRE